MAPGQVLAVIGPNGCGKSTLLKVVAGIHSATEGSVHGFPGDPRLVMGYAGLDLAMYPGLTGDEHLKLAGTLRGVEDRSEELLARVRLSDTAGKPVGQYSSGMRARLKLALAIQARPPILLLDEPSASLDAPGRALVESIILEQRERGIVLLATNDPAEKEWATHELALVG